jgi:hypothetical protein
MSRPVEPNGRLMKSWLPPIWYDESRATDAILGSEGQGLTQFQADTELVADARLPQTAPDWGVTRLESELGLPPIPGMSLVDRQNRVLAAFRGIGTTIYRLKTIASTFGYGSIAISPGVEDWTLYIQLIDIIGVPPNTDAHQVEIRKNVEAHLDVRWAFHFTLWNEF